MSSERSNFPIGEWSPLPDLNRSQGVSPELLGLLHDLAKNAKLELMLGNEQTVKEFLEVLIKSDSEVFQNV